MLLPSLIFSLLAAAALWVFARRNPALDPRLTAIVMGLLLILPLLNFVPKIFIETGGPTGSGISGTSILPALWLTGIAVFAVKGLLDLLALRRWSRQSRPSSHFVDDVEVRIHPSLASPVVAGLIRPVIFLPQNSDEWSPETLRMALLHELGHIQRRDLWMSALAYLTCIAHWFNPAVWWMRRTFLSQCEYACDAHLLKKGADPQTYATALCDVAQFAATPPLSLAMAGHVPLRERIIHLSTSATGRRRGSVILPTLIIITATSAVAMSLVKFVPGQGEITPAAGAPAEVFDEVDLRFTANPFPADQ